MLRRFSSRTVIFGIITIVIILGLLRSWVGKRGLSDVEIEAILPYQVSSGMPFGVKIAVTNRSNVPFDAASLSLALPAGVVFLDKPDDQTLAFRELGGLDQGERREEAFDLLVVNQSGTQTSLEARLNYAPQGVASRFETRRTFEVPIGGEAIAFTFTPVGEVEEGEEFPIELTYQNMTDAVFPYVKLHLDIPQNLTLRTTLPREQNTDDFIVGDLDPSERGAITLKATVGEYRATTTLRTALMSDFRTSYLRTVAEEVVDLTVQRSPVTVSMTVNNNQNFIAAPGDALEYKIRYENGSNEIIYNAILRVQLTGALYDLSALQTDGIFTLSDRTIQWNQFISSGLAAIPPHTSGEVFFRIKTLPAYPIRRLSDRNFTLKADAEFLASREEESTLLRKSRLETKVRGDVAIGVQGYFRDAASGILNEGSLPLRVNQPTDFTIHFAVTNYSTDVSGIRVRARLGDRVAFTNMYENKLPGTTLTYHPDDAVVTWEIPALSPTRGVLDAPGEVIFQVRVTPSQGDAGRSFPILGDVSISAVDTFTNLTIQKTVPGITSITLTDSTVGQGDGIVVP